MSRSERLLIALLVLPAISTSAYHLHLAALAAMYVLFLLSWDLFSGTTGETNFGHAFLVGGAAHFAGWLSGGLAIHPAMAVLLAGTAGGVAGYAVGSLTFRLTGPYFSMATMVLQILFYRLVTRNPDWFGGEGGRFEVGRMVEDPRTTTVIAIGTTVLVILLVGRSRRSRFVLALRWIGSDPASAAATGIGTGTKITGFAASGMLAGMAGGIFASTQGSVGTEILGDRFSTHIVLLALIGGSGTFTGPALAAVAYVWLREASRAFAGADVLVFATLLAILAWRFPDGIVGASSLLRDRLRTQDGAE